MVGVAINYKAQLTSLWDKNIDMYIGMPTYCICMYVCKACLYAPTKLDAVFFVESLFIYC